MQSMTTVRSEFNLAAGQLIEDIIVDADSTLIRTLDAMDSLAAHGVVGLPGNGTVTYDVVETWDDLVPRCGGLDAMLELFDRAFTYESMLAAGLFDGAREGLEAFQAAGLRSHVWSDRPARFEDDTARFLRDQGVPFDTIDVRQPFDKVALAAERGIRVIVDDKPSTIIKAREAGMTVFALRFRYNAEAIEQAGAIGADSWPELTELVQAHVCR